MSSPSIGASSSMLVCCKQRMRIWCEGCGCHFISIMAKALSLNVAWYQHSRKATLATSDRTEA